MTNLFNRNDGTFAQVAGGDITSFATLTGFTTAPAVLLSQTTGFGYVLGTTAGAVLTSTGVASNPTFQAPSSVTLYAPNVQFFTAASGTYTTPTNGGNLPLYIKVTLTGSGCGGAPGGTQNAAAVAGSAATFGGGSFLSAGGGTAGGGQTRGGIGGAAFTVNGAITQFVTLNGGDGGSGIDITVTTQNVPGGIGGSSWWGGGGRSGSGTTITGNNGEGYGSGGGGGGTTTSAATTGGGGGAGGTIIAWLTGANVVSSYTYNAPSGGAGGTSSTNANSDGGNGMDSGILVEAYWQ